MVYVPKTHMREGGRHVGEQGCARKSTKRNRTITHRWGTVEAPTTREGKTTPRGTASIAPGGSNPCCQCTCRLGTGTPSRTSSPEGSSGQSLPPTQVVNFVCRHHTSHGQSNTKRTAISVWRVGAACAKLAFWAACALISGRQVGFRRKPPSGAVVLRGKPRPLRAVVASGARHRRVPSTRAGQTCDARRAPVALRRRNEVVALRVPPSGARVGAWVGGAFRAVMARTAQRHVGG